MIVRALWVVSGVLCLTAVGLLAWSEADGLRPVRQPDEVEPGARGVVRMELSEAPDFFAARPLGETSAERPAVEHEERSTGIGDVPLLEGVVARDGEAYAVVVLSTGERLAAKVGETVQGWTVVAIEDRSVWFERDGDRVPRRLFAPED